MQPSKLRAAIKAAKEFLSEAEKIEIIMAEDKSYEYVNTGKQTATVKRRSMDLTNALADLRRSGSWYENT